MIFVIIGGASGSGKTGLSHHLLTKLKDNGMGAQILNMDDYYHEIPEGVDLEYFRKNTNFDTPDMLHLDLLQQHIAELNKGKSITKPVFDFKSNSRVGEETVHPSDVIIMEGIFAQYFYKKFGLSNFPVVTVNITTENYLDVIERRIKRDIEQRGRARLEGIKQEKKYVGPGFLKYTASSSVGADVYVCNEHRDGNEAQQLMLDINAAEIVAEVNRKLKEIESGILQAKKVKPNVQEMVAKSHLIAGTLFHPHKFEGYFSGVFGDFKGNYEKEFSEEEINQSQLTI
ncbi:uridine kinase family protein [Legionella sainthelensi]|uniref:Uridine kinase n=1 Tax=Legionella sainthelensi TaxID=28087 RepID=A0A2H5FIM2_9GAMM|nr:uridine kinase [Legionella sainthelensi]AUH71381.1 uridine kinase [Legionella sainthelensi]